MKALLKGALAAFALGLLAGAGAGLYRPQPKAATEAQLRERALEYYKAGKVFDFRTMASLYSPAYQLESESELRNLVAKRSREFASFKEETRSDLQYSANSITPDRIEVEINGRWAKSTGTCLVRTGAKDGVLGLEPLVWVQSGGQWWIYQMKLPELATYGNPPDRYREMLDKPGDKGGKTIMLNQAPGNSGQAGGGAAQGSPAAPQQAAGGSQPEDKQGGRQ